MKKIFLTLKIFKFNFHGSRFLQTSLLFTLFRTFSISNVLEFLFLLTFLRITECKQIQKWARNFRAFFAKKKKELKNEFLTFSFSMVKIKEKYGEISKFFSLNFTSAEKKFELIILNSVGLDLIFSSIFLHFCWSDSRKQNENVAFVNWQFVFEKL